MLAPPNGGAEEGGAADGGSEAQPASSSSKAPDGARHQRGRQPRQLGHGPLSAAAAAGAAASWPAAWSTKRKQGEGRQAAICGSSAGARRQADGIDPVAARPAEDLGAGGHQQPAQLAFAARFGDHHPQRGPAGRPASGLDRVW